MLLLLIYLKRGVLFEVFRIIRIDLSRGLASIMFSRSVFCCLLGLNLGFSLIFTDPALAEEYPQDSSSSSLTVLEPVTVVGTIEDRITGKNTLTESQINALPQGNGSINELLTVMPSVQGSEMANTSLLGGEITPPNISISGGKVYDNNFMIDGMGVNNLLDPMSDSSTNSGLFLPGHPQSLFIDSSLVDKIEVYDSNVSSEFSEFTGGVVAAETVSPGPAFGGKLRYRTTRNQWSEFHLDDEEKENFENSNNSTRQPKFDKYDAGLTLNIPLTDKMGIITSYSILDSQIRLTHLGETKDQMRRRETFFVKYKYDITDRDVIAISSVYQPENADYFYADSYASDYTVERETYNLKADYQHFFDVGEFNLKAGYLQSDSERNAPSNLFSWKVSPSKPWGALVDSTTSREGMVGSLEESQQDYQLKSNFTFTPIKTGSLFQTVKVGGDYERVRGFFERDDDSYQYYSPVLSSSVVCDDGAIDCISGEQYFTRRIKFQSASVVESIDQYHFYIEDQIKWERLKLRPGLNISYNDFMKNTDYAPRMAGSYDLFGNDVSVLIAGMNRYYGKTLLAYKLREAGKPTLIQKLNVDTSEWETTSYGASYLYSKLDTPYIDEFVLGLDQRVFGGIAKLRYVQRDGEDEYASQKDLVAREDGVKYITLNNNGSSSHEEYSVEWERSFGAHYVGINATYQETKTSNENYSDTFDDVDSVELCWFDGETYPCDELLRRDYNRPWVFNFIYSVKLPYHLTFTNFTKYRSGYVGLDSLSSTERTELGISEDVALAYQEEKQPESWIFNWRLDWRHDLYRNYGIQLSLEINNVFNQKVSAGAEESIQEYEIGRQFWAGMEYYF